MRGPLTGGPKHPYDRTSLPEFPHPPPLLRPLYDIFSGAVHIDRPYGALIIFHTGGSVVGVGVEIMVLRTSTFRLGADQLEFIS